MSHIQREKFKEDIENAHRQFRKFVRAKLKDRNDTQKNLANALDISNSEVSRWLSEDIDWNRYPRLWHLVVIAKYFDVPLGELLTKLARRTFTHNNIVWEENLDAVAVGQRSYLEKGIEFFRACIGFEGDHEHLRRKSLNPRNPYWQLQSALRSGALRIVDVIRNPELENALYEKYSYLTIPNRERPWLVPERIIVADVPVDTSATMLRAELVAHTAVKHAFSLHREDLPTAMAFGGGYTIFRLAEQTPFDSRYGRITWWPLHEFSPEFNEDNFRAPNHIARLMMSRHPQSRCKHLPFAFKDAPDELNRFWKQCKQVQMAFISCNGPGRGKIDKYDQFRSSDYDQGLDLFAKIYNRLVDDGYEIAGELGNHFYDFDGNVVPLSEYEQDELSKRVIPSPPEVLTQIASHGVVWMVAARGYKAQMVRVALENHLVNGLVIDKEIATEILAS